MQGKVRALSIINGLPMHVPASFAGILPTSPCETDFAYEAHSWLALQAVTQSGDVVYDAGASYGIVSAMLAQAGAEVHAFEANSDVIARARELWETNRLTVTVNEACVGEQTGGVVEFFRAPGLSSVASSRHAVVAKAFPDAAPVRVPLLALDDYALRTGRTPRVLKIDVEGSEWVALEGARRLIETAHPHIVMETHPRQIIGATFSDLCRRLEHWGYQLFDLLAGQAVTADAFSEGYAALPGYLMASVRLHDPAFLAEMQSRHDAMQDRGQGRERYADTMAEARRLMETDAPAAARLFDDVVTRCPQHAEAHYLLAFCLHTGRLDWERALRHYALALQHGFDPFWVEYNWGALLFDLGRKDQARPRLERAHQLNSQHEGVRFYLGEVG